MGRKLICSSGVSKHVWHKSCNVYKLILETVVSIKFRVKAQESGKTLNMKYQFSSKLSSHLNFLFFPLSCRLHWISLIVIVKSEWFNQCYFNICTMSINEILFEKHLRLLKTELQYCNFGIMEDWLLSLLNLHIIMRNNINIVMVYLQVCISPHLLKELRMPLKFDTINL